MSIVGSIGSRGGCMRLGALALIAACSGCSPFGASGSTREDTATPPEELDRAVPDAGGAEGGATADAGGCTSSFCETFDDDALEARGWTRTGDARVVAVDLASKPASLRTESQGYGHALAFIERALTPAPTVRRLVISAWVQVETSAGPGDIFAWRRRGRSSGVFVARASDTYRLESFGEADEPRLTKAIASTFAVPTRITVVLDYERAVVSLDVGGEKLELALPPTLPPDECDLLLGISWAGTGTGRWIARYDDLVVQLDP